MRDKLMTSIVLYGSIEDRENDIWDWYQYSLKLNEGLGYPSTHLGIIGDSFKSGKLSTMKRTERNLKKALENGESIETVSIYSLPEGFTQAAFDFNTFISMNRRLNQFIIVSVPSVDFSKFDKREMIRDLGHFITCREAEVFELSILESPLIYASKVNQESDFKSLKKIDKYDL
ncbi:hypothetical protein [Paenibacillus oleatilyticus]|uniref:hypothetical protein n=1 Tax=Paenibacillus oleatilyticus TaxID=2594886 RepID=UPI001C1F2B21|nr:hypothetical protein [Paenibacillus oleatilyticus]MBU7315284.1 hypothetical protein [Paenibacillus oleatilyticus]